MIDDDINKINDIIDELKLLEEMGLIRFDYEMEVKKACSALERNQYDILILDIQLPNLGDKVGLSKDGGINLLKIIDTLDRIKKPNFIIGLTGYDESYEENVNEFQKYLWVLLKYDRTVEEWKKQIHNKVLYLIKAKQDTETKICTENLCFKYDCAIITAVDIEFKNVFNCVPKWDKVEFLDDSTQYYVTKIQDCDSNEISLVLAKQHQMGMVPASVLSYKLIQRFKPRIICMLGIAAGRIGEVELGDIIIANESWDYGSGKIKMGTDGTTFSFEPEPHQLAINPSLKEYLLNDFSEVLYDIRKQWNNSNGIIQNKDINIHVGALASGSSVIQNENVVIEFIQPQNRKVKGLDMETYAVYFAACNVCKPKPLYLSMKTVCDFANQYKDNQHQDYAAFVSANFFFKTIQELIKKL